MFDLMYRDPQLVKKIGEATALEVRATGIPYVFAPCIAVIHINIFNSSLIDRKLKYWTEHRCAETLDGVDVTKATVKITKLFKQ